jgi:hypothetical protein
MEMLKNLKGKSTKEKSTLSTEDSLARTLVLQEMESAWAESEVDFSLKLSGLQKKFSQVSFSLKMSQQLELEDYIELSKNLPSFGMTVDGRLYLPKKLELRTLEKGGSFWPTPMASDFKAGWGPGDKNRSSPRLQTVVGGRLNPTWVEWLMNYPTGWTELKLSATA